MTIREDILAKLTAEPVTKINGEPRQCNINLLEQELAEKTTKIKITEDVRERNEIWVFSSGIRTTGVWISHWQPGSEMGHSGRPQRLQQIHPG